MSAIIEEPPQVKTLRAIVPFTENTESAIALVNMARSFKIVTVDDRVYAERLIQALDAASTWWHNEHIDNKNKAYAAYQSALRLHDDKITELDDARKKHLKQECIRWDAEQEAIRRAEETRLQAIAQKQAEDEALAMAAQAEAAGDHEIAEAIVAAPVVAPTVRIIPTAPTPSRLTAGRSDWTAEVVNLMTLVQAVAAGTQPIELLLPNQVALNRMAKALHSGFKVPGVRAVERKV